VRERWRARQTEAQRTEKIFQAAPAPCTRRPLVDRKSSRLVEDEDERVPVKKSIFDIERVSYV
jgi:hypothetical protein